MNKNHKKYGFVACLLLLITVVSLGATSLLVDHGRKDGKEKDQEEKMRIVTSFYPMYIAALNIVDGCNSVILENLSEPQTGCLHDYQLTPEDMLLISKADVLIVNGGGIENFLSGIAAEYPDLRIIEAGEDVEMIGENAHFWMDTKNYQRQIQTISKGLSFYREADLFEKNAKAYCKKVESLARDYRELEESAGERVLLFHEAYEYVAKEWGLEPAYLLNLDEERQVSAGEIADVLSVVRKDDIKFILAEQRYGEETAETVRKEVEVQPLYLDTCVRGNYEKDAYLMAMEKNLKLLREALQK